MIKRLRKFKNINKTRFGKEKEEKMIYKRNVFFPLFFLLKNKN
ncbi:hypothetical protein FUSO4_10325 [Fusobacterium necrophorum DJ-1]|nr:hypothetical protein FUSO4_10325 [Fusobacterium necrophorum DJ-1]